MHWLWGVFGPLWFLATWDGPATKSLDQSAALSQCRHSTPSLTAACTTCFFCVVLFVLCLIRNILSKNHVCIVWSLLSPWYCIEKKNCGEKNYEVCWPSPCKKKNPMLLLGRILKCCLFLYKREIYGESLNSGECATVLDLIMIYWKYINFTLGSGM